MQCDSLTESRRGWPGGHISARPFRGMPPMMCAVMQVKLRDAAWLRGRCTYASPLFRPEKVIMLVNVVLFELRRSRGIWLLVFRTAWKTSRGTNFTLSTLILTLHYNLHC